VNCSKFQKKTELINFIKRELPKYCYPIPERLFRVAFICSAPDFNINIERVEDLVRRERRVRLQSFHKKVMRID